MKLDFAFLADAATISDDGRFAVVGGGFDVIQSATFPAIKHAMALVGRVVFEPREFDKPHIIRGAIIGPDGGVVPPELWLNVTQFPHPEDPQRENWTTICLNYQGVSFPSPGDYFLTLSTGDKEIGRVRIDVRPLGEQT
jgi:hypothetical protein